MEIQAIVNAMGQAVHDTRADYHLTLGGLIEKLKGFSPAMLVRFVNGNSLCEPHSYRGYYSDLAFEESAELCTVEQALEMAQEALGNTYVGYKGGDFTMSEKTPLWMSTYGINSQIAIMDAQEVDGSVLLITKQID